MRYFFRDELEAFLDTAGLSLADLTPFPDMTTPLSSSWNVLATVRG